MTPRRYPLEPLAAAHGVPLPSLGRLLGISGRTWQEVRDRGVTERCADRYAVRLGLVAANVWPELIDHGIADAEVVCPECSCRFLPLRRSHRFCTRVCYQRRYKREKARRLYASDPEFRAAQIAKARAYREDNQRATRVKKRAYYLANREQHLAAKKARYHSKKSEGTVAA